MFYRFVILLCIVSAPIFAMEGGKAQPWDVKAFIDKHWNKKDLDEITQCVQQELANALQTHKDGVVEFLLHPNFLSCWGDKDYQRRKAFLKAAVLSGAHCNSRRWGKLYCGLLYEPVKFNDIDFVTTLLNRQADPNLLCYSNRYPLYYAQTYEMGQLLMSFDARPTVYDCGLNLIAHTIENSYDPALISLYIERGVDVNQNSNLGTPLHFLSDEDNRWLEQKLNVALLLLQNGADSTIRLPNNHLRLSFCVSCPRYSASQYAFARAQEERNEQKKSVLNRLGGLLTYYHLRHDRTTFCSWLPHDIWAMALSYVDRSNFKLIRATGKKPY